MNNLPIDVNILLFCDCVKQEMDGDYIIFGPNTKSMVFYNYPASMDDTWIYLEVGTRGSKINSFQLSIFDKNDTILAEATAYLRFKDWSLPGGTSLKLPNFSIEEEGTYSCRIRLDNDCEWQELSKLHFSTAPDSVRSMMSVPPQDAEEFRSYLAQAVDKFMERYK